MDIFFMKHGHNILSFLIIGGLIALATGCQNNLNYESFVDLEHQGRKVFTKNLKACESYGQLHSKRSEGSQGAGERLLLNRNLTLSCMKNKQWILKTS
ncbi:MAG: hypothetical protein VW455_14420 [Nitrospinota bacterium]